MHRRPAARRLAASLAAAGALAAAGPPLASAESVSWANPAGGDWSSPANWSPARVPGPDDDAFITLGGTYTVELAGDGMIRSLTLGAGAGPGAQMLRVDSGDLVLAAGGSIEPHGMLRLGRESPGGLDASLRASGDLTNAGEIELLASGPLPPAIVLEVAGGSLVNLPGGWIRVPLESLHPVTVRAALDNRGTIDTSRDCVVDAAAAEHVNTGTIHVASGRLRIFGGRSVANAGVIAVEGNLEVRGGSFSNRPGGLITGRGYFDVTGVSFTNAGTVHPGSPVGLFFFMGEYVQAGSGVLSLELAGTDPDSYSTLFVEGDARLAGLLSIEVASGFAVAEGDTFMVEFGNSRTGELVLAGAFLPGGLRLRPIYRETGITLEAVVAPAGLCDPGAADFPAGALVRPELSVRPLAGGGIAAFDLALPEPAAVRITVYDVRGRVRARFPWEDRPAGRATTRWEGRWPGSGWYGVRADVEADVERGGGRTSVARSLLLAR